MENLSGCKYHHYEPVPRGEVCDYIKNYLNRKTGYHCVLDADIKAFYDTIPHKLIMQRLREKIADGWVLTSIEKMLKAGVMEDEGIL
ncbi:MAG: hypothetical protein MRJ65_10570 [Candidatus Brocadiaceae bacterium]|nr:hypothetical protein [Candidatus Brocadiaceae bacterium]